MEEELIRHSGGRGHLPLECRCSTTHLRIFPLDWIGLWGVTETDRQTAGSAFYGLQMVLLTVKDPTAEDLVLSHTKGHALSSWR